MRSYILLGSFFSALTLAFATSNYEYGLDSGGDLVLERRNYYIPGRIDTFPQFHKRGSPSRDRTPSPVRTLGWNSPRPDSPKLIHTKAPQRQPTRAAHAHAEVMGPGVVEASHDKESIRRHVPSGKAVHRGGSSNTKATAGGSNHGPPLEWTPNRAARYVHADGQGKKVAMQLTAPEDHDGELEWSRSDAPWTNKIYVKGGGTASHTAISQSPGGIRMEGKTGERGTVEVEAEP